MRDIALPEAQTLEKWQVAIVGRPLKLALGQPIDLNHDKARLVGGALGPRQVQQAAGPFAAAQPVSESERPTITHAHTPPRSGPVWHARSSSGSASPCADCASPEPSAAHL